MKSKKKKIRILSIQRLDEYVYKNNLEDTLPDYAQLSDEQFIRLNEEIEKGWAFDTWDEFVREFNADGNLAPVPSEHIIRVC